MIAFERLINLHTFQHIAQYLMNGLFGSLHVMHVHSTVLEVLVFSKLMSSSGSGFSELEKIESESPQYPNSSLLSAAVIDLTKATSY